MSARGMVGEAGAFPSTACDLLGCYAGSAPTPTPVGRNDDRRLLSAGPVLGHNLGGEMAAAHTLSSKMARRDTTTR